jgi:hypothetical protein
MSSKFRSKAAKRIMPMMMVMYIFTKSKMKHAVQYDLSYIPLITCRCFSPDSLSFTRYLPMPDRKIPNAMDI